jgi:DNA-directed RNA polymerase subunit RPC12/RpoP
MHLEDDALLCPYCGSVETEERRERAHDCVYGCMECDRTFSAPR